MSWRTSIAGLAPGARAAVVIEHGPAFGRALDQLLEGGGRLGARRRRIDDRLSLISTPRSLNGFRRARRAPGESHCKRDERASHGAASGAGTGLASK
jgi:hypothetical protein